ncbi:MAG: rhamnogalacturonan lyase [Prevotella sp.]|nr:rhamnogalacturonan lyase [Prevotella sp.]
MKKILLLALFAVVGASAFSQEPNTPVSQMEQLDRGLVAIPGSSGKCFVSWRLLGTDDENTTFEVLKNGNPIKSNIYQTTSFMAAAGKDDVFQVATYQNGQKVDVTPEVKPWAQGYLRIPLNRPEKLDGKEYYPNDCSVGDVDGDGQYEIFLKWDPENSKDNANTGYSNPVIIDCYKLDGTQLWRVNLGINIRAGAHYTQFMVYDFDGDGKAEMICKTAPGSSDGEGKYVTEAATIDEIKNASNTTDYRNTGTVSKGLGHVLAGPEYLTVFNGMTGAAMHTIHYNPSRAGEMNKTSAYPAKSFWNDDYGNRADRFLACVAYLDGPDQNPSAVMCRGYYTKAYIWAVDWDGTELKTKWLHASVSKTQVDHYDSNFTKTTQTYSSNTGKTPYSYTAWGNGNHNISVADVDGDGCDEVCYGSATIDNDGKLLYAVGFGHGDAMHLADLDPDHPGYEIMDVHEEAYENKDAGIGYGYDIHDARTGEVISSGQRDRDTGRGLAADWDAEYRGCEFTFATQTSTYNCKGRSIYDTNPGMNFRIFWDGDAQEELLNDITISKWDKGNISTLSLAASRATGSPASCNSTKATPCLQADIFGDWREEVILWNSTDASSINVYSSTYTTNYRVPTLMHDHVYRLGVAWQNVAYNQPPHLGYYLPDFIESFQGVEPTGIVEVQAKAASGRSPIYNLNGQRVQNASHGIFVRDGKKYVVK